MSRFRQRHLIKRHFRKGSEVLHFKRKWRCCFCRCFFVKWEHKIAHITHVQMQVRGIHDESNPLKWFNSNGDRCSILSNCVHYFFYSRRPFALRIVFGCSVSFNVEYLKSATIVQCFESHISFFLHLTHLKISEWYVMHRNGKQKVWTRRAAWCKQPFFHSNFILSGTYTSNQNIRQRYCAQHQTECTVFGLFGVSL